MIYKFTYNEIALEFNRNRGRAMLETTSPTAALAMVRDLFRFTRDESVQRMVDGRYQVDFKVALDYRLPLLRSIDKTVRLLSAPALYQQARYIDRYTVASIAKETGKPDWIPVTNLKTEISELRKAAVVAREVANVARFVDWDICIHNYIELNSKEGFRSRVVRSPDAASDPEESMVDLG
jgi:hypothetical protein